MPAKAGIQFLICKHGIPGYSAKSRGNDNEKWPDICSMAAEATHPDTAWRSTRRQA